MIRWQLLYVSLLVPPSLLETGDGQALAHLRPAEACRGKTLGVDDADGESTHADSLSVLWPATTIVTNGSSFTMSFMRDSMSPMRCLSAKCNDAALFEVMVNFGGLGVA